MSRSAADECVARRNRVSLDGVHLSGPILRACQALRPDSIASTVTSNALLNRRLAEAVTTAGSGLIASWRSAATCFTRSVIRHVIHNFRGTRAGRSERSHLRPALTLERR
jgi:hypothetical protein